MVLLPHQVQIMAFLSVWKFWYRLSIVALKIYVGQLDHGVCFGGPKYGHTLCNALPKYFRHVPVDLILLHRRNSHGHFPSANTRLLKFLAMLDPRLPELHTKLWKQEQLQPTLFHTVDVTRAHYAELQNRLNAAEEKRNSENYITKNIISIKLDILQIFVPDAAAAVECDPEVNDPDINMKHEGDSDEVDSDDDSYPDELFEFLPATIRYLDITPLQLQHHPRISFPLLLRDEYDIMSNNLQDMQVFEGIAGSCLITGQPGIGEPRLLSFISLI